MVAWISVQFTKDDVITAVVEGNVLSPPDDFNFLNGAYQEVYMETLDGVAYIKTGALIPKHLTLLSPSRLNALRVKMVMP